MQGCWLVVDTNILVDTRLQIKNNLAAARNLIRMSLLAQRSVVEQFSFNGKKVHSVHVEGEEYLVLRDVYMAIGYEEENGIKPFKI